MIGNRALQAAARGHRNLDTHNRSTARALQQGLAAAGYELPRHGVDGRWGRESADALARFRRDSDLGDGPIDSRTLLSINRAAHKFEGPRRGYDMDRLLADGRLDMTVAIGHSDYNAHALYAGHKDPVRTSIPVENIEAAAFREWLKARGFEQGEVEPPKELWHSQTAIRLATGLAMPVDIRLRFIRPGKGAAAEFARGLTQDEIVAYNGHARYGSGPDFDAKGDSSENFRVSVDKALKDQRGKTSHEIARDHGVALDEVHDFRQVTESPNFDRNKHRVWFFQACTSMAYLDEVRGLAGGPQTIDVIGSVKPTRFTTRLDKIAIAEVQAFLDSILANQPIEEALEDLNEVQAAMGQSKAFATSGFGHK